MKRLLLIICFVLVTATGIIAQQKEFPKLTGPHLGQKPPGTIPEIFAPGIVSIEGLQLRLFITPDGSEIIYLSVVNVPNQGDKQVSMNFRFINIKMKNNIWQQPEIIPFSKEYRNDEPSLSYDGNKLFFVSNRPSEDKTEPEKMPDIWMSERREEGWGFPVNIGRPVNTEGVEVQPYYSKDN